VQTPVDCHYKTSVTLVDYDQIHLDSGKVISRVTVMLSVLRDPLKSSEYSQGDCQIDAAMPTGTVLEI